MKLGKKIAAYLGLVVALGLIHPHMAQAGTHYYGGVGYGGVGYYKGMKYAHGYYGGTGVVFGAFSKRVDPSKTYKIANTLSDAETLQEEIEHIEKKTYYYIGKTPAGNEIIQKDGQVIEGPLKGLYVGNIDESGKLKTILYEEDGNTIIKDVKTDTTTVIPTKYVEVSDEGLTYAEKGNKRTYYNLKGEPLHGKPFKEDYAVYEDIHGVSTTGKSVALFNVRTGQWISDEVYSSISWNGNTGLISAYTIEGTIHYYDDEGIRVDSVKAQERISHSSEPKEVKRQVPSMVQGERVQRVLAPYSEGIAFVLLGNKQKVAIDEKSNILFSVKDYDTIEPYRHGLAKVTRKARGLNFGGFFNSIAAAVVRGAFYHQVRYGEMDYAWTTSKIKQGYINHKGEEVISSKNQTVSPLTEAGIMTYKDGRFGLYTKEGTEVFPMIYKNITYMPERGAFLLQNEEGKWGVKSQDNEELLPFMYDKLEPLIPTVLSGKIGKEYSLISMEKFHTLPRIYESITAPISLSGVYTSLIGKKDSDMYLIDPLSSEPILKLPNGTSQVTYTTLDTAVFKQNGKVGVISYDGTILVEPKYEKMSLFFEKAQDH